MVERPTDQDPAVGWKFVSPVRQDDRDKVVLGGNIRLPLLAISVSPNAIEPSGQTYQVPIVPAQSDCNGRVDEAARKFSKSTGRWVGGCELPKTLHDKIDINADDDEGYQSTNLSTRQTTQRTRAKGETYRS